MHLHTDNTSGSILGSLSTVGAMLIGAIEVHTLFQTAICAAIGAGVGYIVTYTFKKITSWAERKLKIPTENTDNP
ncbi:hypothetical protein [Rufibacter soli]